MKTRLRVERTPSEAATYRFVAVEGARRGASINNLLVRDMIARREGSKECVSEENKNFVNQERNEEAHEILLINDDGSSREPRMR